VVPDPERFELVRKMWDLLLSGAYSPARIADVANNDWGYRTMRKRKFGGRPINASTLYNVFRNPFYTGSILYKGKVVPGNHTPMITPGEFARAQELLGGGKSPESRPQIHEFAFTGCISCAECGCAITGETKTRNLRDGSQKSYTYYHCTHRKDTRDFKCPERKNIEEREIRKQVSDLLSSISIRPEFLEWAKNVLKRRYENEAETQASVYSSLNKVLEDESKKRNRLTDLYIAGGIDEEEFKKRKKTIEKTFNDLQLRRNGAEE